MIRLAKLTDYGIVVLTYIASDGGEGMHNARDISAEVNLPLPTVSKLLKILTRGGLLIAHRGVKGGYQLSRPPQEINVAEIIRALEGPISITDCVAEPAPACMIEVLCPVRVNWQRINDAVYNALRTITLAEMAQSVCRCGTRQIRSLALAAGEPTEDHSNRYDGDQTPSLSQDGVGAAQESYSLRAQGAEDEGKL